MSNAPRSKANVASSRFHHGAGSKAMKRQRPGVDRDELSAESSISDVAVGERKLESCLSGAGAKSSKKRFVGVRQRPSGRWVAEIKDTTQKIRLWLGTFDSAEEGAKAYDSAARALRGANTRTNFVPAMASEGTTAGPASKATRLIRLRQMAAASKGACEKEGAARNAAADHANPVKVEPPQVKDSPALVRHQGLQESVVTSLVDTSMIPSHRPASIVDDHHGLPLPPVPTSCSLPKPPRLTGRRHYAPPQPKPEQPGDGDDAPPFDHSTVENHGSSPCIKLEVDDDPPPTPKLEPQQSITSENNLSNARNYQCPSPPPLRFPSPRSSPFVQEPSCTNFMADVQEPSCTNFMADVQSVNSFVESPEVHHLIKETSTRFVPQRFSAYSAVDNFVAPVSSAPIANFHTLEASRQVMSLGSENTNIGLSGLTMPFPHGHQLSSCATNREDHTSMYKDEVMSLRSSTSSMDHGHMRVEDHELMTDHESERSRASTVQRCNYEEMDYGPSSEMTYRVEVGREDHTDRAILREKLEYGEIHEPEIPWADYVLMDETGMDSGLLGLVDLSCENSGVYTSAFDFSVEAIDRDSCTSVDVLEHDQHLSNDSEFLLRMQYEPSRSSPSCQSFPQPGCVLLTEDPANSEPSYSMSSPQAHTPSPQLWQMHESRQSTGSPETSTADQLKPSSASTGDAGGECTSLQDHDSALWSSMDLPTLCMVA